MQEQSPLYNEILQRLTAVRRREERVAFLRGSIVTSVGAILLLLAAIVFEQVFVLNILGRTILFSIIAMGILALTCWYIGRPLLRMAGLLKTDDTWALARKVGIHFPHIRDRLLDALQIYTERERLQQLYSPALIDASFSDLYHQIKPLDFSSLVSNNPIRKVGRILIYAVVVVAVTIAISPAGFYNAWYRVLNFNQSFASELPIEFIVEPGNLEVVRGETIPIVVHTKGKSVRSLLLLTRQLGQADFESQELSLDHEGSFHSTINAIKASTEYFVKAGDNQSTTYRIDVMDRPLVRTLQLKITPPSYTRLPAKTLDENVGDVAAYPGTFVAVDIGASTQLRNASLVFNDSSILSCVVSGLQASAVFNLKNNRTYHILLTDKNNLHNTFPIEYTAKALSDEYPSVQVLAPAKNLDLTERMSVSIAARLKDDFGFSSLRLAYRLVNSRYEKPAEEFSYINILLQSKSQSSLDAAYEWDLSSLSLVPEDVVAYYIEVFDNDAVSGPKSGRSETYLIRLPSLEEVFSDVNQTHEQSMESLQNVAKEAEQLKKDIEDLQREMKKTHDKTDWQQQKKAEDVAQRYDEVRKKVQEAGKQLEEMMKKLDENSMLSPETMQKYEQLQKLMQELNSPELQEALKKLQQSMKQMTPEQAKQSVDQLKFTEDQFRQNLERTIELLKRIHIEQKIDELIKRAEELAKQQESLKNQAQQEKSSAPKEKRDTMANQQRDLQKQEQSLENEASELKKKMDEFAKEMPLEEMSKAEKNLKDKQLQQKMSQSARQMQSGQMNDAEQNQEQTAQALNEFQQQMKQVQQSLLDKQMKQIVNQLRKQLQNIVELSKREEELKDNTRSLDPNSQQFRENAQGQNEIMNDLGNVANELTEVAKKSFAITPEMGKEIGNALKQMADAMQGMEGRNPGGASQKQGEAMGSLNRAAMQMQESLNGMMNGSGQSGMGMAGLMGRLGQMAGMQGGVNSSTQQAMGSGQGQGQGVSPEQAAQYGRIAGQQGGIQKSLEELAAEAKNSGEFSKLLGDLDRVAQEMKEVQTDLEQGNVNPNTIQKQERILSRLLDSQRSMRERDYEKRRKAETGKVIQHTSPGEIDLTTQEGKNKLRQELMKVLEGTYTKDYEELIRKYFNELEQEHVDQH